MISYKESQKNRRLDEFEDERKDNSGREGSKES